PLGSRAERERTAAAGHPRRNDVSLVHAAAPSRGAVSRVYPRGVLACGGGARHRATAVHVQDMEFRVRCALPRVAPRLHADKAADECPRPHLSLTTANGYSIGTPIPTSNRKKPLLEFHRIPPRSHPPLPRCPSVSAQTRCRGPPPGSSRLNTAEAGPAEEND